MFERMLWLDHPALARGLSLCPLLAVTTRLIDAVVIGMALLCTLIGTSLITGLLRPWIAAPIRLPVLLLITATLVTIIDLSLQAWVYSLHAALGIYLPLLAVTSLVLAWLDEVVLVGPLPAAITGAAGAGLGMLWLLAGFGLLRELFGHGSLLAGLETVPQLALSGPWLELSRPLLPLLAEPAGAFLLLGLLCAGYQALRGGAAAHQEGI